MKLFRSSVAALLVVGALVPSPSLPAQTAPAAPPAATPAPSATPAPVPADQRLALLSALKQELVRSKERLKLPGEDPPYFIRYLVREYDDYDLSARFGALLEDS